MNKPIKSECYTKLAMREHQRLLRRVQHLTQQHARTAIVLDASISRLADSFAHMSMPSSQTPPQDVIMK